jgi:hypothetical protein
VRFHEDRSEVRQLTEVTEHLAAIREEREMQEAQLPQLAAIVPTDDRALSLLERLEAVASGLGVVVEVRSIVEEPALGADGPTDSPERADATPVPESVEEAAGESVSESGSPPVAGGMEIYPLIVTLRASAPPAILLNYVDAVEHMEELVQIRSVRLSVDQAISPGEGIFGLSMEIAFYLQRQPDGSGN